MYYFHEIYFTNWFHEIFYLYLLLFFFLIGSSAKIRCSSCKSNQESTKQLTMKKLPIVASFHLKRFEHSSKLHKKISTRIAFPENLNMTPFVSHKRNNARSSGMHIEYIPTNSLGFWKSLLMKTFHHFLPNSDFA